MKYHQAVQAPETAFYGTRLSISDEYERLRHLADCELSAVVGGKAAGKAAGHRQLLAENSLVFK